MNLLSTTMYKMCLGSSKNTAEYAQRPEYQLVVITACLSKGLGVFEFDTVTGDSICTGDVFA